MNIIARNHQLLLASAPGSTSSHLSDPTPDTISPYQAAVADFGTAELEPIAGVLGRYTLEVLSTAPVGTFALTLTNIELSDAVS